MWEVYFEIVFFVLKEAELSLVCELVGESHCYEVHKFFLCDDLLLLGSILLGFLFLFFLFL